MIPKAITLVERALSDFERDNQMPPRVVLLPRRVFEQFEAEQMRIASVMPGAETVTGPEWADVRVVEHEGLEDLEVY